MNGEGNQDNPGGRNSGGGKLMSFLAGVNLLATIVIAVFAAFIDNRQKILQGQQADLKAALDARVQLEGITQVYTDKIFAHLADLKLEGSDYAGMVIDLFGKGRTILRVGGGIAYLPPIPLGLLPF